MSLFLVPKGTAGVEVRLLPSVDETRKLCEVRLDSVAVPATGLLGELHQGWPADRLGVLERNILRIGISELEADTVPPEVAISEAVGLAKKYASPEAARLVNGILARVLEERAA